MKFNSLIALVLLMPMGIGFTYNSKLHWRHENRPVGDIFVTRSPQISLIDPLSNHTKSYSEAISLAKTKNKKIFLFFANKRCEASQQMQIVLNDLSVRIALKDYIFYKIDVTGHESHIARQKCVRKVPTCLIMDCNGKGEKLAVGYRSPKLVVNWLTGSEIIMVSPCPTKVIVKNRTVVKVGSNTYNDSYMIKSKTTVVTKPNNTILHYVRWLMSPSYRRHCIIM